MSDQRPDDETLGRALGRAIESQTVRETPYAASRLARRIERPAGPGWTYALPIAAALALFVAMGAFFATRGPQNVGTPDASVTPAVSATLGPVRSTTPPSPTATPAESALVYFARDQLPPVGARVVSAASPFRMLQAAERISARLRALWDAPAPGGAALGNYFRPGAGHPALTSVSTTITGDTATVILDAGAWGGLTSNEGIGLVRQLVYTITEEPGVRRVALREPGKDHAIIGNGILKDPLSREDVAGYREAGSVEPVRGFGERGGPARQASTSVSVDAAPGLARFVVEIAQPTGEPTRMYPDWDVTVARNDESLKPDGGKWRLTVQVYNATDAKPGFVAVDRTPLRSITTTTGNGPGTTLIYELALDDLRPWRTALAFDPVRIIVDIGGHPRSISGRNAVYSPQPNETVGRTIQLTGVASAFEANVQYRVRDAQGRIVASGFTTATNCCEPGGTFTGSIQVPASVPAGNITLEVFQGSPRDGSDLAVIAVPLTLR